MKYAEVQEMLNKLDEKFFTESKIEIYPETINNDLPDVCSLEIWLHDKDQKDDTIAYLEINDGDDKDYRIRRYYSYKPELEKQSKIAFFELQKRLIIFLNNRIEEEINNGN